MENKIKSKEESDSAKVKDGELGKKGVTWLWTYFGGRAQKGWWHEGGK